MKTILCILFILSAFFCKAQDVLVKTDKSEAKVKVVEITESTIKYKKWENPDGPLYNITKSDVFMIIYSNGEREIIKQINAAQSNASSNNGNSAGNTTSSYFGTLATASGIDTSIDYKSPKVKYSPTRLLYWFESSTIIGFQQEIRLFRNTLNAGFATDYFMVKGYSQTLYSLYAEPYLPLNRITGNYEKQDKGLFTNAKIGYSSLSVSIDGKTESAGGVMYGLGADYFITKGFGLSLSAFKFSESKFNYQAGICLNIL